MFCRFFAGLLKIIAPGVGIWHDFSAPGLGFRTFFVPGGVGEFALSKKFPGGGWSGLELTDT